MSRPNMKSLQESADRRKARDVRTMIDRGGDVNAVDKNGNTALHIAASKGHIAVVNVLLNLSTKRSPKIPSQLAVTQVPAAELDFSHHPLRKTIDVGETLNQKATHGDNLEIAKARDSSTVKAVFKGQATRHMNIGKKCIFKEANVNACNKAKMTPLHLACQNGHTSIVEILLDNHAIVDVVKQTKETPLYLAAKNGHAAVSDLLMRRGVCDFVRIPFVCETPLHDATDKGHTEVVEIILKHSRMIYEKLTQDGKKSSENTKGDIVPVELKNFNGRRISAEIVYTEMHIPVWIKRDSNENVPLALAASSIDPNMVELLISVDQCMYSEKDIADSFYSFLKAITPDGFEDEDLCDTVKCRMKFRKVAQLLINLSNFNVNHRAYQSNTFLHEVIQKSNTNRPTDALLSVESNRLRLQNDVINDVIQLLLANGADFNMKNIFDRTPLMIVSQNDNCDAINILFDWEEKSGTRLDIDAKDQYGATALITAARWHHISVVQLLLSHKASVNLYDYFGFTALHAAIYEPNANWYDLNFFYKGLRENKLDGLSSLNVSSTDELYWNETLSPFTRIDRIHKYLECNKKTVQFQEDVVKLLLENNELDVNALDLRGNTPLDLAVMSSKRVSSTTFEALQNRGAIHNLVKVEEARSFEAAEIDERGRNPLHRLIIENLSRCDLPKVKKSQFLIDGILQALENFRHLANSTDDKGRTPLHYAVIPPSNIHMEEESIYVVRMLLKLGSKVNATDTYGKTPLHYAEMDDTYKLLVRNGANENTKDKHGHSAKYLKQLRNSVKVNEDDSRFLPVLLEATYESIDSAQVLNTNHVTELTRRRLVETIRIRSQSPRHETSSEEAIWKIWTQNDFFRINSVLGHLKPSVQHFIERLADGIRNKDDRFECHPILVGSAEEETRSVISTDFDFNFKLIKFQEMCEAFPYQLSPKGYFLLRRKPSEDEKSRSEEKFNCFFNLDQFLMTNEVNTVFKILVEDVLEDHKFWLDEQLLEWDLMYEESSVRPFCLCMTLKLRMIHPTRDGEGHHLFANISIDIVACVDVGNPIPVGISSSVRSSGPIMVFDRPFFDPYKQDGDHFVFSETFAKISFAPLESAIIKESAPVIKAAYMVCKLLLSGSTYQLKNCLLFCIEALNAQNINETSRTDEITPKELVFWVERIMFCYLEFSRRFVFPCYFMPSFKQSAHFQDIRLSDISTKFDEGVKAILSLNLPEVYVIYLNLCPDDTAIDIPVTPDDIPEESLDANHDRNWKQFDRNEFMRKLSARTYRSAL